MRTVLDIPPELMDKLLRETQARTKRKAVLTAIETYLRLKKRERLASLLGKYQFGYTLGDLERMRSDE